MDPAESVTALFEAFASRDHAALVALTDPECRFWPQGTAEAVGRTEPYLGHDGLREYLDDVEEIWERLVVDPAELRVARTGVVSFGTATGRPRGAAEDVSVPVIWVFRLRDERILTAQVARTAAEARALVGPDAAAS